MNRPAPCREPDYLPLFDLTMADDKQDYQFGVMSARPICDDLCSIKEWCLQTFADVPGVIAGKTLPERKGQIDQGLIDRRRTPPACGSEAGYHRHRALRKSACAACKLAHSVAEADRKAKRDGGAA